MIAMAHLLISVVRHTGSDVVGLAYRQTVHQMDENSQFFSHQCRSHARAASSTKSL